MNSLISVIVPVYNVEIYLKKCIDSILNQTYKNLEIILVDDGSTDSSGQICDEYEKTDARIKVLHKENGGQASARNMALDICAGEYIAFVDSDDYIRENMYETMLGALLATSSDIAFCGISANNGVRIKDNPTPEGMRVYENAQALLYDYLTTPYIFTGPVNKLYKKEIFDGIRFPQIRAREDAYIMHELLGKAKKSVHTAKCLYVQFIRPGSTEQASFNDNKLMLLQCSERLQEYISQFYPQLWDNVKYKHMGSITALMEDILRSFLLRKNKSTYNMLLKELGKEVLKYKNETDSVYLKYKDIFDHNGKFILKSRLKGVKRRIKVCIQKVIIKVTGGTL